MRAREARKVPRRMLHARFALVDAFYPRIRSRRAERELARLFRGRGIDGLSNHACIIVLSRYFDLSR